MSNPINSLPSQKIIRGEIADSSGHSDFEGSIAEAAERIAAETGNGKWLFVDGTPFVPGDLSDPVEYNRLSNRLADADGFTMTPKLKGGLE